MFWDEMYSSVPPYYLYQWMKTCNVASNISIKHLVTQDSLYTQMVPFSHNLDTFRYRKSLSIHNVFHCLRVDD